MIVKYKENWFVNFHSKLTFTFIIKINQHQSFDIIRPKFFELAFIFK